MDDLDADLDEAMKDPEFAAAHADGMERDRLLDALVASRERRGLTQAQVAKRMGIGQTRVSDIEREGSDPRISTMQRYARALGLRLRLTLAEEAVSPGEAPGR